MRFSSRAIVWELSWNDSRHNFVRGGAGEVSDRVGAELN
jgi:hypothetical protein